MLPEYPANQYRVAPFTGAWIEIKIVNRDDQGIVVAPFTGAWIEICMILFNRSHISVAPFTGAWIEINHGHYV